MVARSDITEPKERRGRARNWRVLRTLAVSAAAFYLTLVVLAALLQRTLLYPAYLAAPTLPDPAAEGAPDFARVTLRTEDGLDLPAYWAAPPEGAPTLVFFHGNASDIGAVLPYGEAWRRAGYGVLLPEYRGYGGAPGSPSEAGLTRDARAAHEYLLAQGVSPARLVIAGASLGSGVATALAAERPSAALILEAPFTSTVAAGQHHYPILPVGWLLTDRWESVRRIASIDRPLLIVHGTADEVIPVRLGRALFAAASEPKRMVEIAGAGHNDLWAMGALDAEWAFLAEVGVGPSPPATPSTLGAP